MGEPAPSEQPATEPVDAALKRASERATWLQVLLGVVVAVFLAGVTTHAIAGKLATKADLEAAMKAHVATPHGPDLARRLDELEMWRAVHQAEHAADTWWIRQAIAALLERQGIPRPPERPAMSPAPEQRP